MSNSVPLILDKACPKCRSHGSIQLDRHALKCQQERCSFYVDFDCPLCQSSLDNAYFSSDDKGDFLACSKCNQRIHLRRIKQFIDNRLQVNYQHRCEYCAAPTVHPYSTALGSRCFFFPKCSGQASLFGEAPESLVFLDFETTGLEIGKDYITEIGAMKIDTEGYETTFQTLVNVPVSLSETVVNITGITDEMLSGAPTLHDVLNEFLAFIGDSKIVAHNAEFDVPWLLVSLIREKRELVKNPVICTLKWAKASGESRGALGALTKKYHISHENAHRALSDVVATKELFFVLESMKKAPRTYLDMPYFHDVSKKIVDRYNIFST